MPLFKVSSINISNPSIDGAKLHIINERYEEIVENYLKIIDDGRFNDDKPTETLEEAQRYR